jgi:hypothetical protein
VLSTTEARAAMMALPASSRRRVVEAFHGMFPTTPEPGRTQRILDHVAERLDAGGLFLLRV